jgi:fructokinase
VTLGEDGALVRVKGGSAVAKGFKTEAIDTTGAGDAFWGGFLYGLLESGKSPGDLAPDEARDFAMFGNAAAIYVGRRGAIPAMPAKDEIFALYQRPVL